MNAMHVGEIATSNELSSRTSPRWCPGCGHFGALTAIERALMVLARPAHEIVLISGSGCAARMPHYVESYGFHGSHGRALPVAMGLKLARPELAVIVVAGDGDAYSIGANHLLHACRRNVDLVCIVLDNRTFGMTHGQASPTTERDWHAPSSFHSKDHRPFNPLALAIAAGASFVARGFVGDPNGLAQMIHEAVQWPGFALIEVLSPCVAFRPDTVDWKDRVGRAVEQPFADIPAASRALLEDDGFGTGVWYRGEMVARRPRPAATLTIEDIEQELRR